MVFLGAAIGVRHARMIALEFGIRKLPRARVGIPLRYGVMRCASRSSGSFKVGLDFIELGRTERARFSASPRTGSTGRCRWAWR
jgi:hypothetical protein